MATNYGGTNDAGTPVSVIINKIYAVFGRIWVTLTLALNKAKARNTRPRPRPRPEVSRPRPIKANARKFGLEAKAKA